MSAPVAITAMQKHVTIDSMAATGDRVRPGVEPARLTGESQSSGITPDFSNVRNAGGVEANQR